MKKFVFVLALMVVFAAAASAEVLVTANPLGQGNLGYIVAGQYMSTNNPNTNMNGVGGFLGYGISDKLDIFGKLAYGMGSNVPSYLTSASGIILGVAGRYALASEKDMPASLSVVGGYQATTKTYNIVGGGTSGAAIGDLGIGVVASKMLIPWIPYVAVVYHSLSQSGSTGSNIELALGTQLALSKSSAVQAELTSNSITMGAASYNNMEVTIGYTAKI